MTSHSLFAILLSGISNQNVMQLRHRLFYTVLHQLLRRQPFNAPLADITEREDILAQRLLRFVKTRRPDNVAAPNVHEIQDKRHGGGTFDSQLVANSFTVTLNSAGHHPVRVDSLADPSH